DSAVSDGRDRPLDADPKLPPSVVLSEPSSAQPSLTRDYHVPPSASARAGECEALDVLSHILGHGANSRLYQSLVVDKAVAVSAGASYDGTVVDNTRLSVFATPKPGTSLPQLEEALDAVLADLVQNGVAAHQLEPP